jgi:hypothetical protein
MKKTKEQLLKEELDRHNLMVEYSFYVGEDDEYDEDAENLILGEEGEEDEEPELGDDNAEAFGDEEVGSPEPEDEAPVDDMGGEFGDEQPADDMSGVEPAEEPMEEPAGDEVEVDVTQLVQGTEEAKASADAATQRMEELLGKFGELEGQLSNMENLSSKIEDLEHEVEKRNPTPDERLEMRSFDSYPYNLKLTDYWAEKEGNYDVLDTEEEGEEKEEFVLTQDDVSNEYNDAEIKNSFGDYEEEEI